MKGGPCSPCDESNAQAQAEIESLLAQARSAKPAAPPAEKLPSGLTPFEVEGLPEPLMIDVWKAATDFTAIHAKITAANGSQDDLLREVIVWVARETGATIRAETADALFDAVWEVKAKKKQARVERLNATLTSLHSTAGTN